MVSQNNKTLVLTAIDVQTVVERYGLDKLMDTLIAELNQAIADFTPERIDIPARSGFHYDHPYSGLVEWMPVHSKEKEVVIKVVGYHPKNPVQFDLPTILSTISSYDTTTGHLKGVVDGVLLTALRTGAASAVASRILADGDSSTLGLIGCGAQAVTQLHGLSRVFDIQKVFIYDSDEEAMNSLPQRCEMLGLNVEFIQADMQTILTKSDIVCTATSIDTGAGPLFSKLEVNPKLHINAVGSDFPGKIELPLELLESSLVCPDFREQAIIEGECQQMKTDDIGPELVEVVQDPSKYKYAKDSLSVFDSTGWALEDQVVMNLFLRLAKQLEIGNELEVESILEDAKNPYHFLLKEVPAELK